MNRLEWAIGLRYALVGRGDRFVSFSSLASVIGMALGVAALIVVMAVMNGFHLNLRDRILSYASHVEIHDLDRRDSPPWPELVAAAEADGRVLAAAPVVDRHGMLSADGNVRGVLVKGVDPEREARIADALSEEQLGLLVPESYNAVLGRNLADRMGLAEGGKTMLIAPSAFQTLGGLMPRLRRVHIAAIVDTGISTYNESLVYMHMEDAARIFGGEGADGVRLLLGDVMEAPQVAADLKESLGLPVFDWTTSNQVFFNALAVERRVMFVILSLIIAVAAFQIVTALVTMVRTKRGAIAILRTIGMPPARVMRIFLIQGMLVGTLGILLGVVVGLLLAVNIHPIVTSVESAFGVDFFPGELYLLEQIPSRIVPGDVLLVVIVAFVLTALATLFPSLTAAKVDPAEVLRHE